MANYVKKYLVGIMKTTIKKCIYTLLHFCFLGFAFNTHAENPRSAPSPFHAESSQIYSLIKDIKHPTLADYRLIQNYLSHGKRENLHLLGDTVDGMRQFKILDAHQEDLPKSHILYVNSKPSEIENCVLIYSSFNRNYPKGLERLVNQIKESDFKGHVLYQTGGWPNLEEGSLVLAHVPYAFKVCFFKEAQRLGYKRALWLDTALSPVVSLNTIFQMIKDKGYFVFGNSPHMCGTFMNPKAMAAFGLTVEEASKIPCCSAGIFGVDFENEKAAKVIDLLYKAAQHKDAFFSRRSDQNALSIILYQQGMTDLISLDRLPHTELGQKIQPDSLFVLDRLFVHFPQ